MMTPKQSRTDYQLLSRAVELAEEHSASGLNGPFGAVITRDGEIIAEGWNRVVEWNDPTAHAEIIAIREACKTLKSFHLNGCLLYTSCEPCPMCLAAIYWAHLDGIIYSATSQDSQYAGFEDVAIYRDLTLDWPHRTLKAVHLPMDRALEVFKNWKVNPGHVDY